MKNLHLTLSGVGIICIGIVYGIDPASVLPRFFNFDISSTELQNVFRAIMGLYIAFGLFWLYGARKVEYWKPATITNTFFMGGLALGRLVSFILDGFSNQFFIGFVLELLLAIWAFVNLRNEYKRNETNS